MTPRSSLRSSILIDTNPREPCAFGDFFAFEARDKKAAIEVERPRRLIGQSMRRAAVLPAFANQAKSVMNSLWQ
jgi:hypothetical protein